MSAGGAVEIDLAVAWERVARQTRLLDACRPEDPFERGLLLGRVAAWAHREHVERIHELNWPAATARLIDAGNRAYDDLLGSLLTETRATTEARILAEIYRSAVIATHRLSEDYHA